MKTITASFVLTLITASLSLAQSNANVSTEGPAIQQALSKTIRYPAAAHREKRVAKVYVGFKVDQEGKVTDVEVLNKNKVDASFKDEIKRSMKELPATDRTYTGAYVLPIVFALEGASKVSPQEDEIATSLDKKSLLEEVYVIGYL